ncbi:MAG: hypothetical protein RBS07_09955 [Lentimicrobium sp.]|nr:hypothetical protein [Lentimicrobium sp.]
MKKFWLFLLVLAYCNSGLMAQRIEIAPYPDAVPISISGLGQMYLSNTDAKTLMEYFSAEFAPYKIIPVNDKYFSGYRLCFSSGSCNIEAESNDWIQILTIDEEAALAWFQKNTPEVLALPFEGIKKCVGENGHKMSDYKQLVENYRNISTKMYQQTIAPNGIQTDELTASVMMTELMIKNCPENLYASLSSGGTGQSSITNQHSHAIDPWNIWINCFDEIQLKGYTTLIEFNEPAITPF